MKPTIFSIVILFSLFFPKHSVSQTVITGLIKDKLGVPIAHSTIRTIDNKIMRIANLEGKFSLLIDSIPINIIVSSVGYRSDTFNVLTSSIDIVLEEDLYIVPEVEIRYTHANKLYEKCVSQLNNNKALGTSKGFMRLYSNLVGKDTLTYELIEAQLLVELINYGIAKLDITNGRYGFIDSLTSHGAVRSIDFSSLLYPLKLSPYHLESKQKLPILPFFKKNYKKYIAIENIGYEIYENSAFTKLILTPKKKYKNGIFEATLLVDEETGKIKKGSFKIDNPQKEILTIEQLNYKVYITSLSLNFTFGNIDKYNYPQLIIANIEYQIIKNEIVRNGISISEVETNFTKVLSTQQHTSYDRINTTIQFVASTIDSFACPIQNSITTDDRKWIDNLLYISKLWTDETFFDATKSELNTIKTFDRYAIFENKFETSSDSLSYFDRVGAILIKPNSLYITDDERPISPKNELVLRLTNGDAIDTIGEYCFDIKVFYALVDNKISYIVLPLFYYNLSWRDSKILNDEFNELFYLTIAQHTISYADAIKSILGSLKHPCQNKTPVSALINQMLLEYRQSRDEMIKLTYLNIIEEIKK